MKLRIVKIKDKFVVQKRVNFFWWEGVDKFNDRYYTWSSLQQQLAFCDHKTLDEARELRFKILEREEDKKLKVKVIE